jgi:hypothetical protein
VFAGKLQRYDRAIQAAIPANGTAQPFAIPRTATKTPGPNPSVT